MKSHYTMATNLIAMLSLIPLANDTVKHLGLVCVYVCTYIHLSVCTCICPYTLSSFAYIL